MCHSVECVVGSEPKAAGSGPDSIISSIEENEALSERALSSSSSTGLAGWVAGSLSVRFVADFLLGCPNWRVLTVVMRLFCGFGAVVAFPGKAHLRKARSWPREPTMGRLRAWRRSFKTLFVRAVKSSPLADGRFACWEW